MKYILLLAALSIAACDTNSGGTGGTGGDGGTGGTEQTCDECFQDGCVECSTECAVCPDPCTDTILCLERVTTCERVCDDDDDSDTDTDGKIAWGHPSRDCCEEVCTDTFVEIECPEDTVTLEAQ